MAVFNFLRFRSRIFRQRTSVRRLSRHGCPPNGWKSLHVGGGLSGIGPLTAKILDGKGVRVIVVGERGKGDAELYDSRAI
ncbi:hypothetical protein F5050DRAFT_1764206 [Lentinula boryana]|uniref:Uncharacterized protein n=1 Tax=Lentinula boryana TaxID=40481 RepID=A0ABQ8QBC3_9AGAR|nr:hypothetical protein F5050DRAFT_1764206 [Lentinula boryana]